MAVVFDGPGQWPFCSNSAAFHHSWLHDLNGGVVAGHELAACVFIDLYAVPGYDNNHVCRNDPDCCRASFQKPEAGHRSTGIPHFHDNHTVLERCGDNQRGPETRP